MRRYLADAGALARKDLLLELRARDTLPAMLLFVIAVLVVFHFALPTNASADASLGLLWVAILFTALLGLGRSFVAEREQGVLDGLVLAPSDRSAITSASARNARIESALPSQIALRSLGASTSPSITPCSRSAANARERPRSAVKRSATQSRPVAASSDEWAGSAKWKTTSVETTKSSIAGSVSRARSSSSRSLRARAPTSAKYVMPAKGALKRAPRAVSDRGSKQRKPRPAHAR